MTSSSGSPKHFDHTSAARNEESPGLSSAACWISGISSWIRPCLKRTSQSWAPSYAERVWLAGSSAKREGIIRGLFASTQVALDQPQPYPAE